MGIFEQSNRERHSFQLSDGLIDFDNKNTDLKASAIKLPFEMLSLINIKEFPLHAKDGLLNFDLDYKDDQIKAKGNFTELSFNIDSKNKLKDSNSGT